MLENTQAAGGLLSPEAANPAQAAPAEEPREVKWESEELTPDELAYFNSRGNDAGALAALASKMPATPDSAAPAPAAAPPAPAPAPVAPPARAPVTPDSAPIIADGTQPPAAAPNSESVGADEDVDLDTLVVDSQGVMRDPKGRYVPHSALHKAREKYKTARDAQSVAYQENETLKRQLATLEGRFNTLFELQKPAAAEPAAPPAPAEDPDPRPNPETDIFGYVAWQERHYQRELGKALAEINSLKETSTKAVDEVKGQVTETTMLSSYKADAQSFLAAKPEFAQAYRHLVDARHAELALMGWTDPAQRAAQISAEEREIVKTAYTQGKRPAEFVYNIAVSRGFRAPAPTPTPTPPPPAPAAPAPAAIAPTATPASLSAAQQLANAAAAQTATATLSGVGGAGGAAITAEALLAMNDAEFEAFQQKVGRSGMRAILGGSGSF